MYRLWQQWKSKGVVIVLDWTPVNKLKGENIIYSLVMDNESGFYSISTYPW